MTNENLLEELKQALDTIGRGFSCAIKICALPIGENDITTENKLVAVSEVLRVVAERAEGRTSTVSTETMLVLAVVLADDEFHDLLDTLGVSY